MATFQGVTASSGAKIAKGAKLKIINLLQRYTNTAEDGYMGIESDNTFHIYGYGWLDIRHKDKLTSDYGDDEVSDKFFRELAPLLDEKLIIHCVGYEKCRFPLSATCIEINPNNLNDPVKYSGELAS